MVFDIPIIFSSAFPAVWKTGVAQLSFAKTGGTVAAAKGGSVFLSKVVTGGKSATLASTSSQLDAIKQTAQKIIEEIEQTLGLSFLFYHLDDEDTAGYYLMKKREEYENAQKEIQKRKEQCDAFF